MKLFTDMVRRQGAGGTEIGAGITSIETEGYHVVGKGAARYVYDSVVDPNYVTRHPFVSFLAAYGRGFRLDTQQRINLHMVGARGDNVTDDHPALQAALRYLASFNINAALPRGNMRAGIPLYGSEGTFYLSDTWEFTESVAHFDGLGTGMAGAPSYCSFEVAANKTGIRLQRTDTEGAGKRTYMHGHGADGSVFRNFRMKSRGGTAEGSKFGAHGFHAKCRFEAHNVAMENFPGNGFHILAQAGAEGHTAWKHGNANSFLIMGGSSRGNNGSGYYVEGADANAGTIYGADATGNKVCGFEDRSFLGNTYIGCHTDGNVVRSYGFHGATNRSVGLGCYAEGNQPNPWMDQHCTWIPALTETSGRASAVDGPGTSFFALFGAMNAKTFVASGEGVHSVQLGSNGGDRFLSMSAPNDAYVFRASGPDLALGRGDTANPPLIMTGSETLRTFGRAAPVPDVINAMTFAIGNSGNGSARIITMAEEAPTTGEHARGEIVFNNFGNAANDAIEYWRCTRSGTPGTWVARS